MCLNLIQRFQVNNDRIGRMGIVTSQQLNEFDILVKQGRGNEVTLTLQGLNPKELSRSETTKVANLLRRCGRPRDAIVMLRPFVRPESGRQDAGGSQGPQDRAAGMAAGAQNEVAAVQGRCYAGGGPQADL